MDAKKSTPCSLSSGFTDQKRTPCGRHLDSSEIVDADASPTASRMEENSVAASTLPYVTNAVVHNANFWNLVKIRPQFIGIPSLITNFNFLRQIPSPKSLKNHIIDHSVTDISQPKLLSGASSSAQPNAEEEITVEVIHKDGVNLDEIITLMSDMLESMKTSKTAQEPEAARDEGLINSIGNKINLKLDAPNATKASASGFVANLRDRFEWVFLNRKECISLLQEATIMAKHINRMTQRTACTEKFEGLKMEATKLIVEAVSFCYSLIDSTISSGLYPKSTDKRTLQGFHERLFNMHMNLLRATTTQLIIEMTTDIERQFPEYAVGPAEEVIAQASGIATKEENEVGRCDNRESENAQETERSIVSIVSANEKNEDCITAYNKLEQKLKESLHDIHSFFNGWDWSEVANIVGNSELETLATKELVIKDANTVRVHDAIKSNCSQGTNGTVLTSAKQIQDLLKKKETKDIQRITGIWLLRENKDTTIMTAAELDLMCHSLRVLALGEFVKVEGKCRGVFDKMVFFQAGIPQLPFNVGRIKKLRYFSFKREDFQQQKGYSNAYVRLNSKLQCPRALKDAGQDSKRRLHSTDGKCPCLGGHRHKGSLLNLLTLWDLKHPGDPHDRHGFFVALKDALFGLKKVRSLEDLPHRLGNLICLGREIDLLKHQEQSSIYLESLAQLLSILCSLEISSCSQPDHPPDLVGCSTFIQLSLARCSIVEMLLYRFGELKSLTVLNLQHCWLLKKLPEGLGQLKFLVELDLSFCCSLEDFCTNFHLLRSLQILNLTSCESLKKLPKNFHLLDSLQRLSLQFCKSLEGKSMDNVTKCKKLEKLFIEGSPMLLERWEAMEKEGYHCESSSLVVYTKEEGTSDKDNGASQL